MTHQRPSAAARVLKRTHTITIEEYCDPNDPDNEHAIVIVGRDDRPIPWCDIVDNVECAVFKFLQTREDEDEELGS